MYSLPFAVSVQVDESIWFDEVYAAERSRAVADADALGAAASRAADAV